MSFITSSWCFSSLRKASKTGAISTMVIQIVDIALVIYSIVTIFQLRQTMGWSMQKSFLAPGLDIIAYVILVLCIIAIILSALQLKWIRRGYKRTPQMMMWMWIIAGIRLFEAAIGIYILAFLGDKAETVAFTSPAAVFGVVYWCVATGFLVFFFTFLFRYVRELKAENKYGHRRRHKQHMINPDSPYGPTTRPIKSDRDYYYDPTPPVKKYKSTPKHRADHYTDIRRDERSSNKQKPREFETIV